MFGRQHFVDDDDDDDDNDDDDDDRDDDVDDVDDDFDNDDNDNATSMRIRKMISETVITYLIISLMIY